MYLRQRAFLTALAFAVAATGYSAPGNAQQLEEVIVTARKRAESLEEIPVAITAFSADQLDRGGFTGLQDLSFQTPGLQYHSQGGQIPGRFNTSVRFRGMDTNQSAASQQLGTVFLDGVYMSHGIQGIDFTNVERVEIIKGPQSATFGRSTFAGAVNYITKTPGDEYAGTIIADFSDYGGRDVSIAHEGPITDTLSYRASLRSYGTDGQYISNADGGALGEESTDTFMGTLYWTPTENLSLKFRYMWSRDDDGPAAGMLLGTPLSARASGSANAGPNCYALGVTTAPVPGMPAVATTAPADYFCGALPQVDVDNFISPNTTIPPGVSSVYNQGSATDARTGITRPNASGAPFVDYMGLVRNQRRAALFIDYDFSAGGFLEGAGIRSTTAFNNVESNWVRDFDLTAANNFISQDPAQFEDFTQELVLESDGEKRFRWSIGVSYFEAETTTVGNGGVSHWDVDGGIGNDPTYSGLNLGPGPHTNKAAVEPIEKNETLGFFGSFAFDFTEDLTVDFEWRSQDDDISQFPFDGSGTRQESSFSSFLPRVTVSYDVMDRGALWATYSEGNIPGFINSDFASLSPADQQQVFAQAPQVGLFNDEEELENFEIGFKQAFDNFYFSLVWYTMDWTNLKTRQPITLTDQFGAVRVLNLQFNAGDAELDGIELEGGFNIGENFSGTFSVNNANGEYGTLNCGFSPFKPPIILGDTFGERSCAGSSPARYPEWSGSLSGTYTNTLPGGNWDYFVRLDGEYFGEAFSEEANFSTHGDFWRFNLRGGFEKDSLRIEGYVRNLFDDDNYLAAARWSDFSGPFFIGFLFSQGVAVTPAQKRTIGFKAVYDF